MYKTACANKLCPYTAVTLTSQMNLQGFGGKFGVQSDRVDKSAHAFGAADKVGTNYTRPKPDIGGAKPSSIRAKFENMAKEKEEVGTEVVVTIALDEG